MSSRPDTPREPPLHLPDLREARCAAGTHPAWPPSCPAIRRGGGGTDRGIPAEEYLSLLPTLSRNDDVVIDLIHNEFLLRQELGESPELAEFTVRFPQYWRELGDLFAYRPIPADDPLSGTTRTDRAPASNGDHTPLVPDGIPSRIGRYSIVSEIDSGGFGVVYLGRDAPPSTRRGHQGPPSRTDDDRGRRASISHRSPDARIAQSCRDYSGF